jgi:SAM-dependent methyltransferase
LDLKGKRVLDVGCRDGLFSFMAESMGAEEVIRTDNDLSKPAIEFLIPFFKSKVKMVEMNLYDLNRDHFGLFDVVIFPGVLYHLRYPFWGLKAIRSVFNIGAHFLIETAFWEGEPNNAMLFCPIGDESPYEPTSCTFFNKKGIVDTLTSMGFETVAVEFLPKDQPRLIDIARQFKTRIKTGLKMSLFETHPPPIRTVTRGVTHCVFRGFDKDSLITQYWEEVHHHHSERGG